MVNEIEHRAMEISRKKREEKLWRNKHTHKEKNFQRSTFNVLCGIVACADETKTLNKFRNQRNYIISYIFHAVDFSCSVPHKL